MKTIMWVVCVILFTHIAQAATYTVVEGSRPYDLGRMQIEGAERPKFMIDNFNQTKWFNEPQNGHFMSNGKVIMNFTIDMRHKHVFNNEETFMLKMGNDSTKNYIITHIADYDVTKTFHFPVADYENVCVKDAPIDVIHQISRQCTGYMEFDITPCLTGSYGISHITCINKGDMLEVRGLQNSGIVGYYASPEEQAKDNMSFILTMFGVVTVILCSAVLFGLFTGALEVTTAMVLIGVIVAGFAALSGVYVVIQGLI
jgi:hypothetical protein